MYTGDVEPQSLPTERVTGEPPMGPSIRVIGTAPFHKMDERSRVNFMKVYTVEHNVKVEDFGNVDPAYEPRLLNQFNRSWGIDGNEALPPATRSRYYDGRTYGPIPDTGTSASYRSSTGMPPINEHIVTTQQYQNTTSGHQYADSNSYTYGPSEGAGHYSSAVSEDNYEGDIPSPRNRRSSSGRSDRILGGHRRRGA